VALEAKARVNPIRNIGIGTITATIPVLQILSFVENSPSKGQASLRPFFVRRCRESIDPVGRDC
jgi:hypothetical protein